MANLNFRVLQIIPLFLFIQISFGLYEIEVYRMLGYEEGEKWVGSRVSSFTMVAAHYAGIFSWCGESLSTRRVFKKVSND